jgi:hypothetical protein
MNKALSADPAAQFVSGAAATIYLAARSLDRVSEARRLAASFLAGNGADAAKALRGIHPDVIELLPPEGKETIGIAQVRDAIRSAQFTPTQADHKVCLIPSAEALTTEAANALLKILEEPPRGLQFVLLAEHPSDLLPTIVSRSRLVRLPAASVAQAIERLNAAGHDTECADWIVRLPLRDGDWDRLPDASDDVRRLVAMKTADVADRDMPALIAACLGDDPILRRQGILRVMLCIANRDEDLLTIGVRILSSQTREVLSQFLGDMLRVAFDMIRQASRRASLRDDLADRVLETIGVPQLHAFCLALDEAHRSWALYGPIEGILVSLFLMPKGEDHGG